MSDKSSIGVLWGQDGLYFVESLQLDLKQSFFIPWSVDKAAPGEFAYKSDKDSMRMMALSSTVQKEIQARHITFTGVVLSLPSKDIIFRSFVIPWVQHQEIKALIDYEAVKYVPFPLKDLTYAHHTLVFSENNVKRIRVVFVAIQKETLENYCSVLEQAALKIDVVEPESLSLIRILLSKDIIKPDQTIAIIDIRDQSGKILMVDQGVPLFVREFKINAAKEDPFIGTSDPAISAGLINEVRISLDYFNRQHAHLQVSRALLVASQNEAQTITSLSAELGIACEGIDHSRLFKNIETLKMDFLPAYGASLVPESTIGEDLFFRDQRDKRSRARLAQYTFNPATLGLATIIPIALLCAALIAGAYYYLHQGQSQIHGQIQEMKQKLGAAADQEESQIMMKSGQKKKKLQDLRSARLKSEMSVFLQVVSKILPPGAWLKTLDLEYDNNQEFAFKAAAGKNAAGAKPPIAVPKIMMEGFAYLPNTNEQFILVNTLLKNIKEHAVFKGVFSKIKLESVSTQILDAYNVTSFKIRCEP
ncbi:MAG: pilus assembly protein PilM [Candidatus Omnitrophica bacterium]|nr:pilus assembly protein PilM [Candidatus Omnitrophota bacterium]